MKRTGFWKGYSLVVTGVLALSLGNVISPAQADPVPHLHNALQKLEGALKQLQKAKGARGGHKQKAIEHTEKAIEETKAAIAHKEQPEQPAPAPAPQ